eukprot:TRINITY_DN8730_c1_g1_i1.p1 TRINITY_DN8730_c1_g1~~TRINITY_DN8730_c1_g1_i1.p1  ORF type:complete len:308 (-),score=22.48 TRINITY_DN8730_c1_g1_i1:473-1396(-)
MAAVGGVLFNVALSIVRNMEPYFVIGMSTTVISYNLEQFRRNGVDGVKAFALTPQPGDEMIYAAQITNPKYTLPPTRILAPFFPKLVLIRLTKNGFLTYLIVFNQYMQRMLEELQTALDEDREPNMEALPDPRPYCMPALFSTFRETMSLFVKGIYEILVKERFYPKTAWILLRDYASYAKEMVLEYGRLGSLTKVYVGVIKSRCLNVAADATVACMINAYRAFKMGRGGKYFLKSTVKVGIQSATIIATASFGATIGNMVYVRWGCLLGWMGTELLVFFVVESLLDPWVQKDADEQQEKNKTIKSS